MPISLSVVVVYQTLPPGDGAGTPWRISKVYDGGKIIVNVHCIIESESASNKSKVFLSKKCTDLFSLAEKTLDALYSDICSGLITLDDIKVVDDNRPQVIKLLKAQHKQSVDEFSELLEVRLKEYATFKHRKSQLTSFCLFMESSKLKIEGKGVMVQNF